MTVSSHIGEDELPTEYLVKRLASLGNDTFAGIVRTYEIPVPTMRLILTDLIDRRSAGLGTGSVKPLQWYRAPLTDFLSRAETVVGIYRVWTHHEANGMWFWNLSGGPENRTGEGTEQQCFDAAQSDFETRVKSCLTSIGVDHGQ